MNKNKRLMEVSWCERLTEGKLDLVLMGGAMFSKSLIQFSVDGWGCVPFILFDLRPNYGGGSEDNGNLLQKVHGCTAELSAPNPAPGLCQPTPPLETPGHSQASLGQSLVGPLRLFPGSWCTVFVCSLQGSVSPVLYKCRFYGGVYGNLLQEGLCHTQVCCTQGPCPCSRTLLTHTSAGDTQTLKILHSYWLFPLHCTFYTLDSFVFQLEFCLNLPHLFAFLNPLSSGYHLFILWMYNCISVFFFYVCSFVC